MNLEHTATKVLEACEHSPRKLAALDHAASSFRDSDDDATDALVEALAVIQRGEVEPFALELADVAYVSALVLIVGASRSGSSSSSSPYSRSQVAPCRPFRLCGIGSGGRQRTRSMVPA